MFESIPENLMQLAGFCVLGFFIAVFYEPIRIIRMFRRQGAVIAGVQDFLFLTLAGIISFAYSMELGNGSFRFFYIIGEFFGALIYFVTIGKLISMVSDFIVRGIKRFVHIIKKYIIFPLLHVCNKIINFSLKKLAIIYSFTTYKAGNSLKGLKHKVKIVYNKKTTLKSKNMNNESGESQNAVKAKIRASVQKKA